jgi:hypothetical protein
VSGHQGVQRAILVGWMLLGWAALILLAGLASLMVLHKISYLIALGPYHDLIGTLLVMVAWPTITLAFRFCVKHGLWVLLCGGMP